MHQGTFLSLAIAALVVASCSGGVEQQGTSTTSSSNTGGASPATSSSTGTGGASTSSTSSATTSNASSSTSSATTTSTGTGGGADLIAELKAGPWLFGWSGGLDHYSWVRFDFVNGTQGSVMVLNAACPSCTGYWQCEGQGLFSADPQALSLILQLPAGCNNTAHTLVFSAFSPPSGSLPHATREATVTDDGMSIMAFRFQSSYCDAAFSSCGNPFQ